MLKSVHAMIGSWAWRKIKKTGAARIAAGEWIVGRGKTAGRMAVRTTNAGKETGVKAVDAAPRRASVLTSADSASSGHKAWAC